MLALLGNIAPALVFYIVNHFFGLRPAILTTLAFTAIEIARLRLQKKPITKLFIFTVAMTLVFSTLDLIFAKGLFVRLEPVVTNIVSAGMFVYMAYNPSMLLEAITAMGRAELFQHPDRIFIVRLNMILWSIYLIGKAGVYYQYNMHHSIEKDLAFRMIAGNASLAVMAIISIVFSRFAYKLLFRFHLMPSQRPINRAANRPVSS